MYVRIDNKQKKVQCRDPAADCALKRTRVQSLGWMSLGGTVTITDEHSSLSPTVLFTHVRVKGSTK